MVMIENIVAWCIGVLNGDMLCTPHVPELYKGGPWQSYTYWPDGAQTVGFASNEPMLWDNILSAAGDFLGTTFGQIAFAVLVGCIYCLVSLVAARLNPIELNEPTDANQV